MILEEDILKYSEAVERIMNNKELFDLSAIT